MLKAWLLILLLTDYQEGYPAVHKMDGPRLPADADCVTIRQLISQDLNYLEGGKSVYVECQEVEDDDAH